MSGKIASGCAMEKNKERVTLGIVFILLSALGFALNQACSQALGSRVSVFQKMFLHNLVGVVLFGSLLLHKKMPPFGRSVRLMTMRGVFGFLSTLLVVFATTYTSRPLFEISLLTSTSAIFTMIVAALWLKEKIQPYQIAVIAVCFGGVVITVRPSPALLTDPWCLFAVAGAAFGGGAYCVVRKLRDYANPTQVVFCYGLISCLCSLPFFVKELVVDGSALASGKDLVILLGMGIAAYAGQLFLNLGYQFAEASRLSPYSYVQNVYSLLITLFIFQQSVPVWSYVGALLIIGGSYYNMLRSRRDAGEAAQKEAVSHG